MTPLSHILTTIGAIFAAGGFLAEGLGVAGITFYPVRRRLPVASPLTLICFGGTAFILGVICIVAGGALRN